MRNEDLRLWQVLSDQMPNEEALTAMQKLRGYYRTRTIRSGDLLEVEVYPIVPVHVLREAVRRRPETREAQKRMNRKNAERRLVRLVEANFTEADYYFTGTIEGEELPTLEQVQKMARNFIARMNYLRKKRGLENARYVYVIEGWEEGSKQKRLHVHFIIDGGIDRKALKEIWSHGRSKCDELDPKAYGGLVSLAKYMVKDPRGRKRWASSKNLKQPVITTADRKVSARTAQRIAEDAAGRAAALEKLYPGYEHEETEVRTNPFIAGCYIYAVMRKIPKKAEKGEKKNEQGNHERARSNGGRIRADAKRNRAGGVPSGGAAAVQKRGGRV